MAEVTAVNDLDDLEDYIDTLTQVVVELGRVGLFKPDRQVLMRQYIFLEDTILAALMQFIEVRQDLKNRKRLPLLINQFNSCACSLQDSWSEEVWKEYESLREDGDNLKTKMPNEMEKDVTALQDLALHLARIERERRSVSKRNSLPSSLSHTLEMVDQESKSYLEPKRHMSKKDKDDVVEKHGYGYGCDHCSLL